MQTTRSLSPLFATYPIPFAVPAIILLAAALLARAPTLLFRELNWDEALYWQMARSLVSGHAPYTEFWDRKPPGLFVLLAAIQALFGDSIATLRLATATMVGLTASGLAAIGHLLFPRTPLIGPCAGLLYVLGSMHNGGEGCNAELMLAPFAIGGIWFALRATQDARPALAVIAGLLLGIAMQIKQIALFDAAAAAAALALLPARPGVQPSLVARVLLLLRMALASMLPLLAILGWYTAIGATPTLFQILGGASVSALDATASPLPMAALIAGLRAYAPMIGLGATLPAALPFSRYEPQRWRSAALLGVWLLCVATSLILLRRFADHMFIHLLPILVLITAAALNLGLQAIQLPTLARGAALGLAVFALAGWGVGKFAQAAVETLQQRQSGIPHWGDRTATVAAAMADRVSGPHDVFVVGRLLGIYHASGTTPPTRFPFTMHLWASYAPLDGVAEMRRIMATAPRFVVIDDLWLAGTRPDMSALANSVLAVLDEALDRDYRRDGQVGRFNSRGGGFIGGGGGVTVYRRFDVPVASNAGIPASFELSGVHMPH